MLLFNSQVSGNCYKVRLVDDRYTIADVALYAYTHVADEGGVDLSRYPAIRAWLERVARRPGHVPITA